MGDSDRIFWLGYCYEHGIGIEKNERKAFIYYQKSADMNNCDGIYQVGHCYYLGIGVEMDRCKAFTYYLKSAEAGNSMGIFKTAVCYMYGIGIKENRNEYYNWIKKNSDYGICAHCNKYNTSYAWCQACDPEITIKGWSSGNKDIDNCMKGFQLRTSAHENMIEWIPFDRLINIKKIGQGGFGSVFSATWLDGIRKIEIIKKDVWGNNEYVRVRESSSTVALKTLSDSKENPHDFLKEFDNHMKCRLYGSRLKIYGLTQNTETNEYLMVFQYADNGTLHKLLKTNFQDLTWQTKLKLLLDIILDLRKIHHAGYIHADFHSGNILQDGDISKSMQSYISDLGLSKRCNENASGYIYGVMPYVAPEVLAGQGFTKAADIYSFGVIMSEMSTGQRPFDGRPFDLSLSLDIYRGSRPGFATGTPDCYIKLAKQCMDSDPQKRPSVYKVRKKLDEWYKSLESSDDVGEIKRQFLDADEMIKALPMTLSKHPDCMYTTKIINTQKISDVIQDPALYELYISDNI